MSLDIVRFRISQVLLLVGPLATLAINPWSNFDPISVVKMTVISTLAFLVGFLMLINTSLLLVAEKSLTITIVVFISSLFSSLMFSGAPIDQQVWGVFGRNTGLVAYLSLAIILFATAVVCDRNFYSRLVDAMILTAVPLSIYCFVQITGNDPIGWSSFETFGTLGNVNFLSAFLGMVCVAISALVVNVGTPSWKKIMLSVLLLVDLYIVQSTGSIQGLVVFAVGFFVVLFIRLKSKAIINVSQIGLVLFSVLLLIPSVAGLWNKGPFARFLFQNSNVLRTDYWHAGYEMTLSHPIFGVGMDSYGDWYRQTRGEISTLRGSADRTANTAHNIYLDLSSNGGFPLLISSLLLSFFAIRASYRIYKRLGADSDFVFVALLSTWIGYQMQALVSINQLGVGVWGWLLTGALIGYEKCRRGTSDVAVRSLDKRKFKGKLLPAASAVMAITGMGFGFLLAWFPLNADSRYFAAAKTRDLTQISNSLNVLGTTAWHRARSIDTAYQAKSFDSAMDQAQNLVRRYPRDFFGWRYLLYAPNSSNELRAQAFAKLQELDPFNPEFKRQ